MRHVTHKNALYRTYECVTSHTRTRHVTHMNASRHTHTGAVQCFQEWA